MKHCKLCDVDVKTDKSYCPLCFNQLEGEIAENTLYLTNTQKRTQNQKTYFTNKILLFLSLVVSIVCGFINFLTYNGVLWSLVVLAGVAYIWIFVAHTIMSNRGAFEKVFFQLAGLLAILISTHNIAGGGDWLINYVVPSLAIITTVTLVMISLINKRRKSFISGFLVLYFLMMITSIVLIACDFDTFKILNEINLLVTALAILGTTIFGFKTIKNEISKKLHL